MANKLQQHFLKPFLYSLLGLVFVAVFTIQMSKAFAAAPTGADWFQLLTGLVTGGDNTGDGGTGSAADYNYYYVGEVFTTTIQIASGGTTAANIWVDFNNTILTAGTPTTGSYFSSWSNQQVTVVSGTTSRAASTGFRTTGTSSGTGTFGTIAWTVVRPTAAARSTSAPATLDINIGTIGSTEETNIALGFDDILDSAEDFNYHVWADTIKPFASTPSPATTATGVSVDTNYTFRLCDTKGGEGVDGSCPSPVPLTNRGTGVGDAVGQSPSRALTFNGTNYLTSTSFSCSGGYRSKDLCIQTVNPTSPLSIGSDTRNWNYNTTYTVVISGFRDYASPSQNQLGDANGPNTMDTKTYTFTTEADTTAPVAVAVTPAAGALGVAVGTTISVDVTDKKSATVSGVGVNVNTCVFQVSSPSTGTTVYQEAGTNDVAIANAAIDYGRRYTITPTVAFAESETVSVSVSGCADTATPSINTMTTYNYTFQTVDTAAPVISNLSPVNDGLAGATTDVSFDITDSGLGVSLANTFVVVNGTYYAATTGAKSIVLNGKTISFTATSDTLYTATPISNGYTIVVDPVDDFVVGESVPVIIYSRDTAGSPNILTPYTYSFAIPADGAAYCGTNATWDSGTSSCIGALGSSYCAVGTSWNGSACAPDLAYAQTTYCGTGTTWDTGLSQCISGGGDGSSYCGANTSWDGTACIGSSGGGGGGGPSGSSYCGTGTTWDGNNCVAADGDGSSYCGSNTSWNGSACVGEAPVSTPSGASYCGSNTSWNGSVCVGTPQNAVDGSQFCGSGTTWDGDMCVAATVSYDPTDPTVAPPVSGITVADIGKVADTINAATTKAKEQFNAIVTQPETQKAAEVASTAAAGAAVGVSLLSVALLNPFSLSNLLLTIARLWQLLLIALGLKKRYRPWGTVYDAITKQPLDPAYVMLTDLQGNEIATSITDIDGRYGFSVPAGTYKIVANKTNYTYPSAKLAGKIGDELYGDLYFGGEITIEHDGDIIAKNIPLDPIKFDWNEFAKNEQGRLKFYKKRDIWLARISTAFFYIGFVVSAVSITTNPKTYNIAIFGLYIIMYVLRMFGIGIRPTSKGSVSDKTTNQPLPFSIVRVISKATGKEVLHKVADKTGQYYMLAPNGDYDVIIDQKNPDESYTQIPLSRPVEVTKSYIDEHFKIAPGAPAAVVPPTEQSPL